MSRQQGRQESWRLITSCESALAFKQDVCRISGPMNAGLDIAFPLDGRELRATWALCAVYVLSGR